MGRFGQAARRIQNARGQALGQPGCERTELDLWAVERAVTACESLGAESERLGIAGAALEMRRVWGMRPEECARVLGLSRKTVYNLEREAADVLLGGLGDLWAHPVATRDVTRPWVVVPGDGLGRRLMAWEEMADKVGSEAVRDVLELECLCEAICARTTAQRGSEGLTSALPAPAGVACFVDDGTWASALALLPPWLVGEGVDRGRVLALARDVLVEPDVLALCVGTAEERALIVADLIAEVVA